MALCCEEMYLDLSITSDDNAMLSGSDVQNYQSGGGAFVEIVGLGGAPIVLSSVTYEKCMHALRLHQT